MAASDPLTQAGATPGIRWGRVLAALGFPNPVPLSVRYALIFQSPGYTILLIPCGSTTKSALPGRTPAPTLLLYTELE